MEGCATSEHRITVSSRILE